MSKDDLIDRLRIEPDVADEPRRPIWVPVVHGAALLAVAAAGWAWFSRAAVPEVRVVAAETVEVGATGSRTSVLDASGHVVVRRQPMVAAAVIGKLVE